MGKNNTQPATPPPAAIPPQSITTIKTIFDKADVKKRFAEMLGKNASSFITSVLHIAANDIKLKIADPVSIYQAAAVAATLNLPLNDNLGFAYIVPFNLKQKDGSYKMVAMFQLGYKGFIQLALRSGQFKTLAAAPIYEGQIVEANPLDGYVFDFTKKTNDVIIGYAAKFTLKTGFEATWFMDIAQLNKHGIKYSKSFQKGYGLWKDNFEAMASKTVIKLLLSKYAPLSVEMQKAILADQSVINDFETIDVIYADNEDIVIDKESERVTLMIQDAETLEELLSYESHVKNDQRDLFELRKKEFKKLQVG